MGGGAGVPMPMQVGAPMAPQMAAPQPMVAQQQVVAPQQMAQPIAQPMGQPMGQQMQVAAIPTMNGPVPVIGNTITNTVTEVVVAKKTLEERIGGRPIDVGGIMDTIKAVVLQLICTRKNGARIIQRLNNSDDEKAALLWEVGVVPLGHGEEVHELMMLVHQFAPNGNGVQLGDAGTTKALKMCCDSLRAMGSKGVADVDEKDPVEPVIKLTEPGGFDFDKLKEVVSGVVAEKTSEMSSLFSSKMRGEKKVTGKGAKPVTTVSPKKKAPKRGVAATTTTASGGGLFAGSAPLPERLFDAESEEEDDEMEEGDKLNEMRALMAKQADEAQRKLAEMEAKANAAVTQAREEARVSMLQQQQQQQMQQQQQQQQQQAGMAPGSGFLPGGVTAGYGPAQQNVTMMGGCKRRTLWRRWFLPCCPTAWTLWCRSWWRCGCWCGCGDAGWNGTARNADADDAACDGGGLAVRNAWRGRKRKWVKRSRRNLRWLTYIG